MFSCLLYFLDFSTSLFLIKNRKTNRYPLTHHWGQQPVLTKAFTLLKKVAARLYFLRQLKRVKVPANDPLSFYTTCIRPVAVYACPVFHTALPQYLSDQLQRLQKRAPRIISTNDLSYRHALEVFNIPTLYDRRETIGNSMFQEISNKNLGTLRTLKNRKFQVPRFKTNRFGDSFIISHCR